MAIERSEILITIGRIVSILGAQGVSFHLTGGLAMVFYGEPRVTQDIDLVVRLSDDGGKLSALLKALTPEFLVDASAMKDAVRRKGLFQALDNETFVKVDFHVGEGVPGELSRSCIVEIEQGFEVPIVSREDAILSKLLWIKKGSGRSRDDLAAMLRRKDPFDVEYVERQAAALDVGEIWQELKGKAAK